MSLSDSIDDEDVAGCWAQPMWSPLISLQTNEFFHLHKVEIRFGDFLEDKIFSGRKFTVADVLGAVPIPRAAEAVRRGKGLEQTCTHGMTRKRSLYLTLRIVQENLGVTSLFCNWWQITFVLSMNDQLIIHHLL